jgi:hypothetical protein
MIDRLSPNGCKVLFDWGLENEVRENAVVGEGFMMYTCESQLISPPSFMLKET